MLYAQILVASNTQDMVENGIKGYEEMTVSPDMSARHVGSGTVQVLATSMMIALMEKTCRLSVKPFLDAGQETVGTLVQVRHLAATPVGMTVRCESEVTETDRRRIVFKVAVYDAEGMVGEGIHERFIIDEARFLAKAEARRK